MSLSYRNTTRNCERKGGFIFPGGHSSFASHLAEETCYKQSIAPNLSLVPVCSRTTPTDTLHHASYSPWGFSTPHPISIAPASLVFSATTCASDHAPRVLRRCCFTRQHHTIALAPLQRRFFLGRLTQVIAVDPDCLVPNVCVRSCFYMCTLLVVWICSCPLQLPCGSQYVTSPPDHHVHNIFGIISLRIWLSASFIRWQYVTVPIGYSIKFCISLSHRIGTR